MIEFCYNCADPRIIGHIWSRNCKVEEVPTVAAVCAGVCSVGRGRVGSGSDARVPEESARAQRSACACDRDHTGDREEKVRASTSSSSTVLRVVH